MNNERGAQAQSLEKESGAGIRQRRIFRQRRFINVHTRRIILAAELNINGHR
jgi:hypothetical protein